MSLSVKTTRVGLALVFGNAALVGLVALLRHASAQDASPAPADAVVNAHSAAEAEPSQSDAKHPSSDPILEELRKLIQDPDSGLDVPPISVPPTSPTAELAAPDEQPLRDASAEGSLVKDTHAATGAFRQVRLQMRRLESIQHLAAAALALTQEAEGLLEAGHAAQAEALLRRITELRSTIAALAAATGT